MINIELLKEIFLKEQNELLDFLEETLIKQGYTDITKTKHYVYAKGELPVLLVSHCDIEKPHKQLHHEAHLHYDEENDNLKVNDSKTHYLGADDRAGVYGLIELSKNKDYKPYLLFTTEEEITLFKGVNRFIIDHKNTNNEL